ncbi:hypothetical protein [Sediminitomix flava]|uniref:Uncharacterized protein n=1 Tax=Sediminitomix flava TaxID=379075 RepID=A0A315ZH99_SEDFL|nr:hypothetical protein [Sediminitomix flava]PWJ44563.1 hypothetical protein BC781_101934 [Sediminitomix flava]
MMKNTIKKTIAVFSFLTLIGFTAQAQSTVKRQANQTARIAEGVASGELTKKETRQLKKQQRNIQRTKKAAKADGVVTAREKAVIQRKQNAASKNINRKKTNAADRN